MLFIKRTSTFVVVAIVATVFLFSNAIAAPQILAVASTSVPIRMQCDYADCIVELSTVCLQEHRSSPLAGTEYHIPKGQNFSFTAISKDGLKMGLPSNLKTKIVTARGHSAVYVSVRWKAIRDFGIVEISLSVPSGMALIPVAVVGDANPQTELDIELATGPFRDIATEIIDNDTTKRAAVELVNLTINKLDTRGRSSVAVREHAIASFGQPAGFSNESVALAQKIIQKCNIETQVGYQSLRQCLGSSHDQVIGKLNTKYWNQIKGGS